jgi:hypothetical protein
MMLTHERLTALVSYDPETGEFTWLAAAGRQLVGRRAGCVRSNCYGVTIDKKIYPASRLAWFYVHGEWPATVLRFCNGDSNDVRIDNLRLSKPNSERFAEKIAKAAATKRTRDETFGRKDVTQERLCELFSYEPNTGNFFWRESGKGRTLSKPAGSMDAGYWVIRVDGITHAAQRLAWIYSYGSIPDGQRVKFDNNNPRDRRLSNLRLARTSAEHYDRYHENNPDAQRIANLSRYQGMTMADYDALLLKQGGVCAVCGRPETQRRHGKTRLLSVDHDHDTGTVRGLLCSRCNTSLGYSLDDPTRLRAAADYLERNRTLSLVQMKRSA